MEKERRDRAIAKFKQRLARKKLEAKDPEAKRVCLVSWNSESY